MHYVVEQVIREKSKDSQTRFEEILKNPNQKMTIPYLDRLKDLKCGNNAQHKNIIAGKEEVDFQVRIVEDFFAMAKSDREYFCRYPF
jgi:hypothetical protein